MNEKLLVIDGSSLLSTSFYGTAREFLMAKTPEDREEAAKKLLQTSDGVYTNGVYTFMKTLLNLINTQKPSHMAVVWDISRQTFRQQIAGGTYKGTRKETPHPLKQQFVTTQNLLEGIIPQFKSDFDDEEIYEADDFAGSIAKKFEEEIPVFLYTKDEDYLQLVSENTRVWLVTSKADDMFEECGLDKKEFKVPNGAFEFTPVTLKQVKGIEPYQIIEYKALCGDTSDNIPGVKGVGEKAVIPLLNEYGCIENIYDTIENLAPKDEKALKKFFKDSLGIARSPISYLLKDGIMMTSDAEQLTYKCIEEAVTEEQIKTQEVVREKLGETRFAIEFTCEDGLNKFMNTEIYGLEQSAKESAFMSKQLATIKTDVPQLKDKVLDDLKLDLDKDKLKEKLEKLEIKTLIK